MKLKKIMFLAAILSAVTFSSCSNEENQFTGVKTSPNKKLTFEISIPVAGPTTYAGEIQEKNEIAISSLYIIKFDGADNLVGSPTSIYSNLAGKSPEFTYTTDFESDNLPENEEVYRFLFVANLDLSNLPSSVKNIDDFNHYVMSKKAQNNKSCDLLVNKTSDGYTIPMTGIGYQNGNQYVTLAGGSKANVEVNLTRVVARIDIVNNMKYLNIIDLRLKNTINKSYLLSSEDCKNLAEAYDTTYLRDDLEDRITTLPFTEIPSEGLGNKMGLTKAFYLYEDSIPTVCSKSNGPATYCVNSNEPLTLEVTVNYSGVISTFDIPFLDAENRHIRINRNYLYQITLGDGSSNDDEINFEIICKDWNFKFTKVTINGTSTPIEID